MAKVVTHTNLQPLWGNEDHLAVSEGRSFAAMIFDLLAGRVPYPKEEKLFTLILNISIDHGAETPSAVKVIEAAGAREPMSEAVASGIEQINDVHGGAMEPLMEILYRIHGGKVTAAGAVKEYLQQDKKLPGFGHRIYKENDPRAKLIMKKTEELLGMTSYIVIVEEIERELVVQTGKKLPLNVDGAIAAAFCSFGWEPKLGKAVFIIARTPGLIAHYLNNS